MMRIGWILLVAVLVACQALFDQPVQVSVHCGLDFPVIEYAGSHWKFDAGHDPNPPPGWSDIDTIYIRTLHNGAVQARGPDGLVYRLVETAKTQPDGMCL